LEQRKSPFQKFEPVIPIPHKKLDKLRRISQRGGIAGILRFAQQRLRQLWSDRVRYPRWVSRHPITPAQIQAAQQEIATWDLHPKFSIVLPVYNVEVQWLEQAIESVRRQIYPHWELCIADDASPNPDIQPLLTHYQQLDHRIKVTLRSQNGNISAASNSALALATGDYIALLDHDDELTIDALFANAKLINQHPDADFIYSDEDKINPAGQRRDPVFKPGWSPEYFHSTMYTCHLGVYRTELIRKIGGFRLGYEGSQDYDLVLRVMEQTRQIYHLPQVLYHWRVIPASAASGSEAKPWAYEAGFRALESMLARSPYPGWVEETRFPGMYRIRRQVQGTPLVSVVWVGEGENFARSLDSGVAQIQSHSSYRNLEFIPVAAADLAAIAPGSQDLAEHTTANLPQRINQAVATATGEFVLLLHPALVPRTPDWIESLIEFAQQPEIGAIGAKILRPDNCIQGGGLIWLRRGIQPAFYQVDNHYPGYGGSNVLNRNYLAVSADCLMMRRQVWASLGGLDPQFARGWGIDLCLKAHQAGYRNLATPHVELEHPGRPEPLLDRAPWKQLQRKWQSYLWAGPNPGDPYYNPHLSQHRASFEFADPK
jgi:O-antigen biosynthesis protein